MTSIPANPPSSGAGQPGTTLKPEDASSLIAQTSSTASVLVGGQAVHFWMTHYNIPSQLPSLTTDIDYQGTRAEARRAASRLSHKHTLTLATMDDATPNTAVIAVELDGYDHPIIIDYLTAVFGLNAKDVKASAAEVEIAGERLFIIHPVLLLKAKITNLARLPAKRTPQGVEQARLSLEIVAALLRSRIEEAAPQRELLRMVKYVVDFALTDPAREVKVQYGLDCIAAIPREIFAEGVLAADFHEKYWRRKMELLQRL